MLMMAKREQSGGNPKYGLQPPFAGKIHIFVFVDRYAPEKTMFNLSNEMVVHVGILPPGCNGEITVDIFRRARKYELIQLLWYHV